MTEPAIFYRGRADHIQHVLMHSPAVDTVPGVKLRITEVNQAQKQLRLLKSELITTMKLLRSSERLKRATTQENVGMALFLGRKNARAFRAGQREGSRQQEARGIAEYEAVRDVIETYLLQMEQYKAQLQQWLISNKP